MSIYCGNKSLDAEIILDLINNNITMDYSLNTVSNPYNSNTSAILEDEFKNIKIIDKVKESVRLFAYITFFLSYGITTWVITFIMKRGLLKNKNYQIEHQRILKDCILNIRGLEKEIFTAPFFDQNLICHLKNNLWLQYHLEGDCQTKIKTISLKRHFYEIQRFGKFKSIRQDGWDLMFYFESPPQTGFVFIEHV